MAIAAIHDWLATNGPMARGVELLKLHGNPTPADLFIYSLADTSVTRGDLRAELEAINARSNKQVAARDKSTVVSKRLPDEVRALEAAESRARHTEPPNDLPAESLPEELRPLRRELTDIHATILYLKGRTSSIADGMDLRRHAEEIVALYKRARKGWQAIELYRATGHIMRPESPEVLRDRFERVKRIRNLRVYLTPKRIAERNTTEAEVAQMRKELAQLEEAEQHEAAVA